MLNSSYEQISCSYPYGGYEKSLVMQSLFPMPHGIETQEMMKKDKSRNKNVY